MGPASKSANDAPSDPAVDSSGASQVDNDVTPPNWLRERLAFLRRIPAPIRKPLVTSVGATLIVVGCLLVVLPGPFTLPLIIAGVALLSTEFAWAARAFHISQQQTTRLMTQARRPWVALSLGVLVIGVAAVVFAVYLRPMLGI